MGLFFLGGGHGGVVISSLKGFFWAAQKMVGCSTSLTINEEYHGWLVAYLPLWLIYG